MARVVPDVPTFAVDDGFAYAVPPDLGDDVEVGRLVRVPLSGRRVRGYVTAVRPAPLAGLKAVHSVSGDLAVFGPGLLETLRWAAIHYVAPLATVLGKAAPPNLPRRLAALDPARPARPDLTPPWDGIVAAATGGAGHRTAVVGPSPWGSAVAAAVTAVASSGGSAMVVAPTLPEAMALHDEVRSLLGERAVLGASALPARQATEAWARAATTPGIVVVGTREVALWPVASLRLAIVVGDGRPGLKDKSTPTTHARELLRRRALVERFSLILAGAVPTTDALGSGPELIRVAGRAWPFVEIVDRGDEPPGGGFVTDRVRRALGATAANGRHSFVFTHRTGYAPAFRCVQCRQVRRCESCGARAGREADCPRCGTALGACSRCRGRRFEPLGAGAGRILDELRARLGTETVGPAGSDAPIEVGTERDLVGVTGMDLAVVVDADGLLLAPHYRAAEDALRLMARVAATLGRGRGRRCIVQTGQPHHPALEALRRGDPLDFLTETLAERRAAGFPPAAEVLVLEASPGPDGATASLERTVAGRAAVHGPAEAGEGLRWLIQGPELRPVRVALRGLVQDWRNAGIRVRVDADPMSF